MMRIVKYGFCVNWSKNAKQVLTQVCNAIRNNNNYVKQNAIFIIHHLTDLIECGQWNNALTFMNKVETSSINKWEVWQELSKAIKVNLQNQSMKLPQIKSPLQFLYKVRYEPSVKQDSVFLKNLSQHLSNRQDGQDILRISSFALMHNPQIFFQYRDQMEQFILSKIKQIKTGKQLPFIYTYTIRQGIFADFWTNNFINSLRQQIRQNSPFLKYIQLLDQSIANKIQKKELSQVSSSATQKKIGDMMKDLCYAFEQNMLINGLQVDFLFARRIVLEYDGMLHYKINESEKYPKPNRFQLWKTFVLQKRGFTILRIPFYEWQKLQNEKMQKLYLIDKIQQGILRQIRKNQNKIEK